MNFTTKCFLYFLIAMGICMCQPQPVVTDSLSITLCWEDYPSDSAGYIIYYRNYTGDTTWKTVGFTKESQMDVTKGNKKKIVFGIKTVLFGDTSDFHTSLDNNACVVGACTAQCEQVGPWYLDWKVRKSRGIRKNK